MLGGLIGNDTFTSSKVLVLADTVYTGGGADKVALTVGNGWIASRSSRPLASRPGIKSRARRQPRGLTASPTRTIFRN